MAKAKIQRTFKFTDPAFILSIVAVVISGIALLSSSFAATASPTGTIAVASSSNLKYGGTVQFTTTNSSFTRGSIYINVVCVQGSGTVVYQSSGAVGTTFPLTQQVGLAQVGAVWDTTSLANCTGSLIYRVDGSGKKGSTIDYIAKSSFIVQPN